MKPNRRSPYSTRIAAVVATTVAVAAAVPIIGSTASAAPAAQAAPGTIHVYILNTSMNSAPNKVLITGAFSDHGTAEHGIMHLTKGTITANTAALKAKTSASSFGTLYKGSCSYTGVATGPVKFVRGTGAYAGIKGSFTATETLAEQGSLLKNGKCNESDNAPALAQALIVTATGRVTF